MTDSMTIDITVLITCYNEHDLIVPSIETVVAALEQTTLSWEVLVIDDMSRDDSVQKIAAYLEANPDKPVRLHRNTTNRGLANNFVDGAFLARGRYYRLYCGDNSEPVHCLKRILDEVGRYDIVIPYQDRIDGRCLSRELLSKFFTFLINLISGYHLRYYNGLPIYKRFHVLRYPPTTFGFGYQADMLTRLLEGGASYIEVSRNGIVERKSGRSTAISMRNLYSVTHSFAEILFRRMRRALYPNSPRLLDGLGQPLLVPTPEDLPK